MVVAGIRELNSDLASLPRALRELTSAGDLVHALEVASQAGLGVGGFVDDPSKLAIGGIYIDTDDETIISRVEQAYHALLAESGIKVLDSGPVVRGSWLQRFRLWLDDKDALDKTFAALESPLLREPQSRANNTNTSAVVNLLRALDGVPSAAMQVGPC